MLVAIRRYIPEFSTVDTTSILSGLEELKDDDKYTPSSEKDLITITKRFFTWLYELGEAAEGLKPEKIRKIKAGSINVTKTAEDIITPDQVEGIFKNVSTTRNRAMIELLYESTGRAGEIATLTWGKVTFYQNYASVRLDGKTGKPGRHPYIHLILH